MIDAHFVYVHRKAKTGEVFYVGKGTRCAKKRDGRAYATHNRTNHWRNIVAKHGLLVEVVSWFESNEDCLRMERDLIAYYGRSMDGGCLCNLTLGGEGSTGLPLSAEARRKLSEANRGERHFNWGKKLSPETCAKKSESMRASPKNLRGKKLPDWWVEKIRAAKLGAQNPMHGKTGAAHPKSRKVRDRASGAMYDSVQIAADALGFKMKTLYNWLSGHRPNPTALEFA